MLGVEVFEIEGFVPLQEPFHLQVGRRSVKIAPVEIHWEPGPAFLQVIALMRPHFELPLLPHATKGAEAGRFYLAERRSCQFVNVHQIGKKV